MSYLIILVLLSLLITLHELGHLVAARLVGIPVAGFAVGFGPKVWSRRWGQTEYSLRAFPLGGFVAPAVADDSEFREIALRKRLVFFLGGPLANLLVTLPLFAVLNGLRGGLPFYGLLVAPLEQMAKACWHVLGLVPALVSAPESLRGIVGIVVEGGQIAQTGMVLELVISLSISLAVLNLLPIPVLDGGQIAVSCVEEAFPRLVVLRAPLTILGFFVLAALMVYTNVQDVIRYWG
ncbi:MAG TPA: site-2 protease family protein [Thermoanaerobaculia bacterium]